MVEFQTIKKEEIIFGENKNKFVELARKKAITPEGENIFISLSSGFLTQEGERRYRKSFTAEALKRMKKEEKDDYILVSSVAIVSGKDEVSRWALVYQNPETRNILDFYVTEEGIQKGEATKGEDEFKELEIEKVKISATRATDKAKKEISKTPISIVVSLTNNKKLIWKASIISQDLMASTVEIDAVTGDILKKSETSIGRRA